MQKCCHTVAVAQPDLSHCHTGGLGLATFGHNPGAGVPLALIGAALAARAKVVRFVFDEEAMEVRHSWTPPLDPHEEEYSIGVTRRLGCLHMTKLKLGVF